MEAFYIPADLPKHLECFAKYKAKSMFLMPDLYFVPKYNKLRFQNFICQKDEKGKFYFEVVPIIEEQAKKELSLHFTRIIRKLYHYTLIEWFQAYALAGLPQITTAKMFFSYYGIDEGDYTIDAALKFYNRFVNLTIGNKKAN